VLLFSEIFLCNLTHKFAALANLCFHYPKFANGTKSKPNLQDPFPEAIRAEIWLERGRA
jgi:hypothetical protein